MNIVQPRYSFTKLVSETISRLNNVQKTVSEGFEQGLTKAFGDSATAVGRLLSVLREAEFAAAMQPVNKALDSMTVGIDRVNVAINTVSTFDRMVKDGKELSVVQQSLYEESKALVEENLLLALSYNDVKGALDAIESSKTSKELVANFSRALAVVEQIGGPASEQIIAKLTEAEKEAGV